MQRFLLISLLLVSLMFSGVVYAQGCMGGGSDEGVSVVGFIQPQLEYKFLEDDSGEALNENSITFNRARIGFIGSIPYDVSYYAMLECSPFKGTPYLIDGFVTYTRLEPYVSFSLGKFKSPFSLELNTGCAKLHTINRSQVVAALAAPGRDFGLMAFGHYEDYVNYSFGYMNGTGAAAWDNNTAKDMVGRVVLSPIEMVSLGGSFRFGNQPPASPSSEEDDKRSRFGGELQVEYANFLLQGEYIAGKVESSGGTVTHPPDCSHDTTWYEIIAEGESKSNGYWGHIMYMTPWNLQPVVKYEFYDPDADLDDNETGIITFGINYFINDWSRVQVNYLYKAEYGAGNEIQNDELLIQFQAMFN